MGEGAMIDLSFEARQARRELARKIVACLSPLRKGLREIMESNALDDIYNAECTKYFNSTGRCPSCGNPIESPACSCGCHKEGVRWFQSHYIARQGERIEDQRLTLREWLEDPLAIW